jgi:UDP-3-O-[3-hydroxymyristoyl] glucosamine N-acyltransferase
VKDGFMTESRKPTPKSKTVAEIAAALNCPVPPGAGDVVITGVGTLADATSTELTYLSSDQYVKHLPETRAAVVIVKRRVKLPSGGISPPIIVVDDAELAIAKVLELLAPPVPRPPAGVDPAARVAKSAVLGEGVAIGPFVYVGERTRLGRGTVLHAGVYVGDDVTLGDDCELFPSVVVRERITIGNRVILHAGCVLGTDGFGFRWDGSKHAKVPQIGTITVGDDVEIGSCTCIDRAKFSVTRVGRGTKIDNLVQIAHNCDIGEDCIIAGLAGMAGSARLGRGVALGGGVAIRDHITVGDGAMVAAKSGVAEDVPPKTIVSGIPAIPHRQQLREQGALRRLPELLVQVRKLEEEIAALKKAIAPAE